LPHVDPSKRIHCPPSSLCIEVSGGGRPLEGSSAGATVSPRSPTPPSSQGSKSNSPLLNGHAKPVGEAGKPTPLIGSFFGKHEGFTLSPLKEKSSPGTKTNSTVGVPPPVPPPPVTVIPPLTSTNSTVSNSLNSHSSSTLVASWRSKTQQSHPGLANPINSTNGLKVSISGPSLQGSTNPAIASHVLPSRSAPPPPGDKTDPSAVAVNLPPVAVIAPCRRAPTLAPRPLSVPDASTLVAQANHQLDSHHLEYENKSLEGDKQSTVARIASFLTKKDKQRSESEVDVEVGRSNTLPRKAAKIKRESLMQLEISGPMQLQATELPANLVPVRTAPDPPMPSNLKPSQIKASQEEPGKTSKVSWAPSVSVDKEDKSVVPASDTRSNMRVTWTPSALDKDANMELQRIGSMRETPVTIRPSIPKFGSMRAPRPKSLPPTRPSEPPPRPPLPMIPGTPDSECFYDDCLNIQEVHVPLANSEETSPENIYATIDENSSEKDPTIKEVTYSPQEPFEEKKEKKSLFSFLYNKPKKKTDRGKAADDGAATAEPIYTNLIESTKEENVDKVESPVGCSTSSSLSPPSPGNRDSKRTSCGSSEDGGLLSEIVTELSTRDVDYVNTLSKKHKREKGLLEKDSKKAPQKQPTSSHSASVFTSSTTSPGSDDTKSTNGLTKNTVPKSTSYPLKTEKTPSASKTSISVKTSPTNIPNTKGKSATSITNNANAVPPGADNVKTSTKTASSGFVPRGVFSYLNSGKSKTPASTVASVSTASSINTTAAVSTPTTTTTSTSNSDHLSAVATVPGSSVTISLENTNESSSSSSHSKRIGSLKSNFLSSNIRSNSGPSATTVAVATVTARPSSTTVTAATVTTSISTGTLSTSTTVSNSGAPSTISSSSVQRSNRPVFPPDKVLVFPPDKIINISNQNENAEASSEINAKQATTPTSVANGQETSSSASSKPGRVLSPTRGATPTRGTTPARNSSTTSSGRFDKSRSGTPQPVGRKPSVPLVAKPEQKKTVPKAADKTGTKRAEKPMSNAANKTSDKPVAKKLSVKPTVATGVAASGGIKTGTAGKRIGTANVASLQQKFEKKETENKDSKPLTKAPSRKSQEVRPVVAPKPK
ncbi:hypothetical protein SK128_018440, partial [Halocaridina rubra]